MARSENHLVYGAPIPKCFVQGPRAGEAGLVQFENRSNSGLTGSATGPWTLCVFDTDGFGDTGIVNSWSVHD